MDPDDLPDEIKVSSSKGDKILREYQMRGVRGAVNNMTGILFNSTGSGKTVTALATIQELLPYTEPDERIAFFTDSSAIFNQVYNEFSDTLKVPVGKWGNGKKDIQKVTIAMVPTVSSALKTDPEKGLSLTPKQRLSKKIAKEILPMFTNALNAKLLLTTYIGEYKPKTKADNELLEELKAILDKSESSAKVKFHLNAHNKKYQDILKKKAKKEYEKRKDAEDFMSSLIMFVTDECLVSDTLVLDSKGNFKKINEYNVGDTIEGGQITGKIKRLATTARVSHTHGTLEGSLTHPTFAISKEDYLKGDLIPKETMLMELNVGDYLVSKKDIDHEVSNDLKPSVASFIALVQADGHLDKDGRRVKVNVTAKKEQWVRKVFTEGVKEIEPTVEVKESYDNRGNYTVWVNSYDVKDFLIANGCPKGNKSNTVEISPLIQGAPVDTVRAYIGTLFDCEGDLTPYNKNKANSYRLSLNMTSEPMVNGLSLLLRKFSVMPKVQTIYRSGRAKNLYRLTLTGKNLKDFYDNFVVDDRVKPDDVNTIENKVSDTEISGGYVLSKINKYQVGTEEKEVYDYTTETHTFIANGTLTHNCHHTKSDSFYYTLLKANNAMYRLGLTGSIDKEDGFLVQRLQGIFGDVISRVTNEEMIGYGISATPTIFFSPIDQVVIEGEQVNVAHERNYMQAYDKAIVKNEYRNLIIAKITEMSYNKGRGTLIILNRIEHGDNISKLLDELRVPYEFVQGEVEIEQREKHFEDMRNGQLKVLIATSIMDEGVDISGIDSLIMGAGGKSLRQVLQRVGRGLRHKDYGGNKLYVYDFTDQTNKYVAGHYAKRKEIYQSEGFEIKEL